MRSTRAFFMIALSVLAGIAAVFLATKWIGKQGGQTVPVVVASRDLNLGSALKANMVEPIGWPMSAEPKGAIRDSLAVEGRVLKASVTRGEPIMENKLAPVGAMGGLSAVIKEGKRAVTVKVNEVVGVAGFALPGNFVDVMVNAPDDQNRPISKIVLEHILVLAVAQENKQDQTEPRVVSAVTLEVSPEEAEKLDLSRSIGNLSLVLRNQMDDKPVATNGAHKNDILEKVDFRQEARSSGPIASAVSEGKRPARVVSRKSRQQAPAPLVASQTMPEAKEQIEVIRGLQKSTSDF